MKVEMKIMESYSSEERMAISSCDEQDIKYLEFNKVTDMEDPKFELGMLFSSGKIFREAGRKHEIAHQRGIRLKKNLFGKIKWVCVYGCQWKCYGIKQQRPTNIQIKTLYNKHTCNPTWVQKHVNSTWIARAYENEVRMNPTWPTAAFHAKVVNDLQYHISETMAYRGLIKAKEAIIGKYEDEFKKLYHYVNEVKKIMPTSTIKLMREAAEMGVDGRRQMSKTCFDWLEAKPRSQWSRSGFRDVCKSDVFVNNNCEIFKNPVKKYIDNGIVTMFKNIHKTCMQRIEQRKAFMEKKNTKFCTKALKKINLTIKLAAKASPVWNGGDKYHVTMSAGGHEVVVDLKERSCACRKWQLTGIPCFHDVACIHFQELNPKDFIHLCYSKETYMHVYSHILEPISGETYWEVTEAEEPLSPLKRTAPDCLIFALQKAEEEHGEEALKWQPTILRCSYCKQEGHNLRSCTSRKVDLKTKTKENNTEDRRVFKEKLSNLQKAQTNMCAKASVPRRAYNNTKNTNSHGGIVRPFKPQHGQDHQEWNVWT
ncbi:uncharacterized protein LOC141660801 [Apium graveolens]|uniref:uncharacterized protein LOC141660801 n=1 Tax=Apium graveolens TaxID=4045 RepID=UPI003D793DF4